MKSHTHTYTHNATNLQVLVGCIRITKIPGKNALIDTDNNRSDENTKPVGCLHRHELEKTSHQKITVVKIAHNQ